MSLGKHLGITSVLLLALALAGCSAGSSTSVNSIQTAVQDLSLDPDGLVTVITFERAGGLTSAGTANFSASGGQNAVDVQVVGAVATVTWNARVSPADTVALTGVSGVSAAPHAVATSDAYPPTYTVTSAQMNTGLGADVIVLQFSGVHVVPATAEDVAHWVLSAGGYTMDLSDSILQFDASAQTLTMNLGLTANVWANFTLSAVGVKSVAEVALGSANVAGVGSGDNTAPTLVAAEQNLDADSAGRVVDFSFDEAMSPAMFTQVGRYAGAGSDLAINALALSGSVVEVTFNNPIVPGVDTIHLNGLFDAHGNAFPDTDQAITQPNPLVNALAKPAQAVTLPNANNDYITFVTTVPFDPESAEDWHNWTLHVAGNPINLSTQTFAYDLSTATTTITLDFDLHNGDTFTIVATNVVDVDGVHSALGDFQTVAGDSTAPTVSSVVQNRSADPTGKTVDVNFDEDVNQAQAETVASWSSVNGQNVLSATLQPSHNVLRLVFDAPLIPTVDTVVCTQISDLAGNSTAISNLVTASTDTTPPTILAASANAIAGANNDTLVVSFDDDMWQASLSDPTHWALQSPVGTSQALAGCTVAYDAVQKRATLTLGNGVSLKNGDDFSISFSSVYDLGHNAIAATPVTGAVTSETTPPTLVSAYIDGGTADEVVLTFSEPCALLTGLYDAGTNPTGTRYLLRDSGGVLRGSATAATSLASGLGVRLSFGLVVAPSDTLDVLGVTDLAGNPLYPVLAHALLSQDTTAPTLLSAVATTFSGEANDTLVLVFDRPMSPWGATDRPNYTLTTGAGVVGLNRASFAFDGNATVTITLAGSGPQNLATGDNFTVAAAGLYSAQGALISGSTSVGPQAIVGDSLAPSVGVNNVRLDPATANSLLIEFSEALDPTASLTLANYDLNAGNLATSATLVGPRVVRATFAITPVASDSLDVQGTDLAGNASGVFTRVVQSADTTGPLVTSVSGVSTSGYGGDTLSIAFNEPVTTNTAFAIANYSITSNGNPISLLGATASYDSASSTVVFHLARGQELDSAASVHVTISGVCDVAGNPMAAPVATSGAVSGDTTPPAIASSFVDWAVDASGATIDVGFSEDVLASGAAAIQNWGSSGATSVSTVLRLADNHYRVTFTAPLGAGELLTVAGIADPAGNAAVGPLSSDPLE